MSACTRFILGLLVIAFHGVQGNHHTKDTNGDTTCAETLMAMHDTVRSCYMNHPDYCNPDGGDKRDPVETKNTGALVGNEGDIKGKGDDEGDEKGRCDQKNNDVINPNVLVDKEIFYGYQLGLEQGLVDDLFVEYCDTIHPCAATASVPCPTCDMNGIKDSEEEGIDCP